MVNYFFDTNLKASQKHNMQGHVIFIKKFRFNFTIVECFLNMRCSREKSPPSISYPYIFCITSPEIFHTLTEYKKWCEKIGDDVNKKYRIKYFKGLEKIL